ncbi:Uncharacterized protein HDU89_003709 [Geranomyces variabilis]|nr:Uncharacterized protein HDU89_003709 [Geranomyces variabilis]
MGVFLRLPGPLDGATEADLTTKLGHIPGIQHIIKKAGVYYAHLHFNTLYDAAVFAHGNLNRDVLALQLTLEAHESARPTSRVAAAAITTTHSMQAEERGDLFVVTIHVPELKIATVTTEVELHRTIFIQGDVEPRQAGNFVYNNVADRLSVVLPLPSSLSDEEGASFSYQEGVLVIELRKEASPQVPALEDFTRTAPRKLGFAKNFCIKTVGAQFVEDIKARPPAVRPLDLTNMSEYYRLLHDVGYQRKLVLIDRSDELGASSDDPHACLGKDVQVKRMEGRKPDEVIREAIRNLSPDALIIDEIGSKVEAEALRAAKQAGVTVIATCHGDLPQFVRNRALSDQAGRITVSILGDTMAGSAGAAFRKVKEEREEPPVFDTLVEVEAINQWAIYHHLESVIDTLLAKGEKLVEIRRITADSTLVTWLENRNLDQSSGVMARTGAAAAEGQERDMNNLWILEQAAIARKHYEEEAKEEARKREEKAREEERMRKGKAPMRK